MLLKRNVYKTVTYGRLLTIPLTDLFLTRFAAAELHHREMRFKLHMKSNVATFEVDL